MPRFFTRDQAHSFLPQVERSLRSALDWKMTLEEADKELRAYSLHIMLSGGAHIDAVQASSSRKRRETAASHLQQELERIQEAGCLVKDLDIGLIDFPTLYRGEEVYLCWRFGEPEIAFWHGVSEGFRGRKRIDQEFLLEHRGDAE